MEDTIDLELSNVVGELNLETVKSFQIVILPENFPAKDGHNIDTADSANYIKLLKRGGLNCGNSFDLKLNSETLERRGGDLWFGKILIIDPFVIPLAVSILANYISTKFSIGTKKVKIVKDPNVNLEVDFFRNGNLNKLKYNGDPETLIKLLEQIKGIENGD